MRNVTSYHGKSKLLTIFKTTGKDKRPPGFSVQHYAGVVAYAVSGFLEKNKDPISADLIELLAGSTSPIARALFAVGRERAATEGDTARGRAASAARERAESLGVKQSRGPSVRTTLGGQFRSQLARLMEALAKTSPHFIRCIKPNTAKSPKVFDAPMSLTQLRHAGVFEAVTIRRQGFPYRMQLGRFNHWFKCLLLPRTAKGYTASRSFSLVPWASDDPAERCKQILAHAAQVRADLDEAAMISTDLR